MIVGVTGTRDGLSRKQRTTAYALLLDLQPDVLHHGDCKGVDEEMCEMATALQIRTISHPPEVERFRAHCPSDITWRPRAYLARNHDIVICIDHLLAFPNGTESQRSGTMTTVRYAEKAMKRVTVVRPDGSIEQR